MRVVRAVWTAVLAEPRLWRANAMLRDRPTGHLLDDEKGVDGDPVAVSPAQLAEARRIGSAVERAALIGVLRPKCLVRSLALSAWLRERGIPGVRLRIGARRLDGRFEAHAWVEVGGEVVGDRRAHVAGFNPLTDSISDDR